VRDGDALARLPQGERRQWQQLWDEVEKLRQRAADPKVPGQPPPLAEVASRAGFVDLSHLTRHCKRLLGVTPGKLQRTTYGYLTRG